MFTGIIEEIGTVTAARRGAQSSSLSIAGKVIFDDLRMGDSVAVNGVCLTVTGFGSGLFTADVMHETLNRSSLGELKNGSRVNLERAMSADGRFGGHMVSGHIDGTGRIARIRKDDNAVWYTVSASEHLLRYIIEKGSIAMDGISLTVAAVSGSSFSVSVIPHTAACTTLSKRTAGDTVNLETDMVGKYIEKLLTPQGAQKTNSSITPEFLAKCGY